MNPYHYTHNNPLNRIDPDGRSDFLKTLFGIDEERSPDQQPEKTQVEDIQNAVSEVESEVNGAIEEVTAPVNEVMEPVVEGAKEATIATTAVAAPILDDTARGLGYIAPFTGPLALKFSAIAVSTQVAATGMKGLNILAGGSDFTMQDIKGDVSGLIIGKLTPVGLGNGLYNQITGDLTNKWFGK